MAVSWKGVGLLRGGVADCLDFFLPANLFLEPRVFFFQAYLKRVAYHTLQEWRELLGLQYLVAD